MTEHTYIRSIHDRLKKRDRSVYVWKINDSYQGGVADAYYSKSSDCWVEYKYLSAPPKRLTTLVKIDLSLLQQEWLRGRHSEGRNVTVIIGSPVGAMILPGLAWDRDITTAEFISSAVDKPAVVEYLLEQVHLNTQEGRDDKPSDNPAGHRERSPFSLNLGSQKRSAGTDTSKRSRQNGLQQPVHDQPVVECESGTVH